MSVVLPTVMIALSSGALAASIILFLQSRNRLLLFCCGVVNMAVIVFEIDLILRVLS